MNRFWFTVPIVQYFQNYYVQADVHFKKDYVVTGLKDINGPQR